jgi:hypothetical protein
VQVDRAYHDEAQRVTEDIVDALDRRPPSSEVRLARAVRRIEAGTYTPPGYFRAAEPARDVLGQYTSACGPTDDLGRCSARYHEAACGAVVIGSAATGSYEDVEAWNETVAGHTQPPGAAGAGQALGLANDGGSEDLGWGDPLGPAGGPGSADPGLGARVLASMGETDAPPAEPREDLPDVSGLREALGI